MSIKNDLIIKATANNNTGTVKQSLNLLKKLSNSFDIGQICDKKGNTVLHYAAKNSNYELVKLFINKYKINMNLQNLYGQTPFTLAIGNFSTGVSDEKNLSTTEYFNRRFSRGNNLMIIDLLLKSGAKFDRAEHNYLLGIIEDQKNKNEYVSYCEKIEKTLSLISRLKVLKKQTGENAKRGEKYVKYENCDYNNNLEHIYDTPKYGISGYDNSNDCISEHIYEEVDELRNKEAFSSNMSRSGSVSNIDSNNTWSSWDNDESECQTLSNSQSDDEKGSRTPESGYRSSDDAGQQESKIVALPNRQPNAGRSSIAPKPANPQTRPQASPTKRMTENKISNPSFNKGHGFSSNLAASSIKGKIKMFENNTSSNPSSKVLSGSIKKALNRNNFLLKALPLK